MFVPAGGLPGATPVRLPISTTIFDENRPGFTPDGRYLGYVPHKPGGHDRLFVWDTQTQRLINSAGADLGATDLGDPGNVSLYVHSIIASSTVSPAGAVGFATTTPTRVGILVQRIVGHQKLLGKSAPKLEPVGRVPLGKFHKGRGRARWDGRVNGRRLEPGRSGDGPGGLAEGRDPRPRRAAPVPRALAAKGESGGPTVVRARLALLA